MRVEPKLWVYAAIILPAILVAQDSQINERQHLFPFDPHEYLLGHYRPDTSTAFVELPRAITGRRRVWLRHNVAEALQKMIAVAKQDRIRLKVMSGTRTFATQKTIWEGKFNGTRNAEGRNLARAFPAQADRVKAILRYSSAPGTSRHHWGTDVDLVSTSMRWWNSSEGAKTLKWLQQRAAEFGFFLTYTADRDNGYQYEPWHWSYGPMSRPMLRNYYLKLVTDGDLTGFAGAELVAKFPWREYVLGVNKKLK